MTTPDDSPWRRPTDDPGPGASAYPASGPPASGGEIPWRLGYEGPPSTTPPPAGWRPEFVVQPAAPRPLPAQDHPAIDAEEHSARTLTYGVGLIASAILLIVLCALCGRALF